MRRAWIPIILVFCVLTRGMAEVTERPNENSNVNIPTKDSVINNKDSVSFEDGNNYVDLEEFVVKATKAAVVAKQDTIEYNAGSFKTAPNASVEELLKKLPGVEVGSDGTISSNGKSVTKVLVNGKEFFNDDTQMATKNLPSEIVDKVQVIDRKSDIARLTGVDDGEEETVINLQVKKSMQNGWVGSVGCGYGTDGRYEGSFNVSAFSDNNQLSFVGGINNINDLGFSDIGRGRFRSFGPSGGITDSQRLGMNFNLGKDEKFRIGGNIFYTHSSTNSESFTDRQYLFTDSTSNSRDLSSSHDIGHNLRADLRMEWKPDEYNTLDFRPSFSFNSRNSTIFDTDTLFAGDANHTLVNLNETRKFNKGFSYSVVGDLIYTHNFKKRPGRSFSTQVKYEFSNTHQRTTSFNDLTYYLLDESDEMLHRYMDDRQTSNSLTGRLTWTEPLGDASRGNFLQLAYRLQYRWSDAEKSTYNLPPDFYDIPLEAFASVPENAIFDADLSDNFRNRFLNQELRIGYKKVSKKYNLEAGIVASPSMSESTDYLDFARDIPARWTWNVAPFARLRYKYSKTTSFRADYRARTTAPSLTQLQPVAEVSDPLNIIIGNPDLNPSFTQSLGLHFNTYNQERQQAMFASLRGQVTTNVIASRTTTSSETGGRVTEYSNAGSNMNINGMFMINQPFSNRSWRYSANVSASYNSAVGYINGEFNRSGNFRVAPNFGITFTNDLFQLSLNPTYSFNMIANSLKGQKDRYSHTYGFRADGNVYFPFGLSLSTDLTFDRTTGYADGFNTSSWLWNAQLSYSVLKDKSLTFSVKGYDILGMKKNIRRSISSNMITDNTYNDLTRYVMFGITWHFNSLKNRKPAESFDNLHDFPGPPPGEGGIREGRNPHARERGERGLEGQHRPMGGQRPPQL